MDFAWVYNTQNYISSLLVLHFHEYLEDYLISEVFDSNIWKIHLGIFNFMGGWSLTLWRCLDGCRLSFVASACLPFIFGGVRVAAVFWFSSLVVASIIVCPPLMYCGFLLLGGSFRLGEGILVNWEYLLDRVLSNFIRGSLSWWSPKSYIGLCIITIVIIPGCLLIQIPSLNFQFYKTIFLSFV